MVWSGGAGSSNMLGIDASRASCFEENTEPCLHASGVWITAVRVAGVQGSEINIGVRLDAGCGAAEALDLHTTMRFDSPVLDIIEECHMLPGMASPDGGPRTGAQVGLPEVPLDGEPISFRGSRSFAILLADAVQVFTLSFKAQSMSRPPETPAECCLHLGQLSLPPFDSVDASAMPEPQWPWSFDDARAPTFEEQRSYGELVGTLPDLHLGRWFQGLLRFFAIVLRPVWDTPLVSPVWGRQFMDLKFLDVPRVGLCLTLTEGKVQRLLARLRPVLLFARRALGNEAQKGRKEAPACAVSRSRMYSCQLTSNVEGPAQVRQMLQGVIDVADRVQQVLGLMSVLLAQRSAYRVLQSAVLSGSTLEALLTVPLGQLAASAEGLAPVGQLCTALVIESGLPTPMTELVFDANKFQRRPDTLGAQGRQWQDPISGCGVADRALWGAQKGSGVAYHVCRELEKQCPIIFAFVDLDLCYTQSLSQGAAAAAATPGDVLSRCVQCVSSSSMDDRWEVLTNSMRALAAEDMRGAAEICLEKLQQLQQGQEGFGQAAGASGRAKMLLEALLSVLNPQPEKQSCALVDYLLAKTASLHFDQDASFVARGANAVPFAHEVILNHLLNSPRLQRLLETMLDSSPVKIETFLKDRCDQNRLASEFLWKYYLRHGRASSASEVLLQLSEWAGSDASLAERVHCLDMARQAAQRSLPQSKETVDKLSIQLDVAVRVQVPLCQELSFIAADMRVATRWQTAAERRRVELQRLLGLQDLYQVAVDFGLFHLVLVITNLSSSIQEQVISSSNWVSTFFPPATSPYSPSELLSGSCKPRQHGIFPLLMLRRCATFFAQNDSAPMLPEAAAAHPDDFSLRASRLLEELGSLTKVPSTMWDVRCVGTLLEYCNCLWLKSVESLPATAKPSETPGEAEMTDPDSPSSECAMRAWVALKVLPGRPFTYLPANVVKFYADMLTHLSVWLVDLWGMLPADEVGSRPTLSETDVRRHLCKVIVTVIHDWTRRVELARGDELALADFRSVWPLARGLLDNIASGRAPAHTTVEESLADEARRVEVRAGKLCGVVEEPALDKNSLALPIPARPESGSSGLFSSSFLSPPPLPPPSTEPAAVAAPSFGKSGSPSRPPALEAPAARPEGGGGGGGLFSHSFLSPSAAPPASTEAPSFGKSAPPLPAPSGEPPTSLFGSRPPSSADPTSLFG